MQNKPHEHDFTGWDCTPWAHFQSRYCTICKQVENRTLEPIKHDCEFCTPERCCPDHGATLIDYAGE